ncbi:MAG: hypothetical protein HY906_21625 [Deltaproteobacteria bacterium]|nr:hypothetical protein [Deltaproteobacteria bacterium]
MAPKRTYYPPKTFDDDLAAFAALAKSKGWTFSGVDFGRIEADGPAQRQERSDHDALEGQYNRMHEAFGLAQEERYQRFAAALNAARGAFRNDKKTRAELDRFKRSVRRTRKPPQ